MKSNMLIAVCLLSANIAFADVYIDVNKNSLTCGKLKITQALKYDELIKNCKVVDTDTDMEINGVEKEVKFIADSGAIVKCKFLNGELKLCKIDD